MMRVGLLANTFEGGFGSLAGGHVHFIEVAKRWKGVDLRVFAPEIARQTIERELPAARFIAMPSSDRRVANAQFRSLYRTVAGLGRTAQLRECDVLIATSHFLPDIAPALFSRPRRTIVSIHHILTAPSTRAGRRVPNLISAAFQSLAFLLIRSFSAAVFVFTKDVATHAGIDARKTRVFLMSNGANSPREALDAAQERDGAVYLGRLVPTKGVEDILRAWALVIMSGVTSVLTIAGTAAPDYGADLERLARELGVADSVRFVGNVTEDEKSRLLICARVFAFASKEEGWGIVLAEAMRHGVPCLTYDLPAYRSIFTSGRISVPVGDIEALAGGLRLLLTDDAVQLELASAALRLSASFTWERAAELEYEALRAITDGE